MILDKMFWNAIQENQRDSIIMDPKIMPIMFRVNSDVYKKFGMLF